MPTFNGFRMFIFIIRKRSLGQGNVFAPVCRSVHREGVGFPACVTGHKTGGSASRGISIQGGLPPEGVRLQGGLPPGGSVSIGGEALLRRDLLPGLSDTTGYSQQAGRTHPAGVHSWCWRSSCSSTWINLKHAWKSKFLPFVLKFDTTAPFSFYCKQKQSTCKGID